MKDATMSTQFDLSGKLSFIDSSVFVGDLEKYTIERLNHDIDRLLAAPVETAYRESELSYVYIENLLCVLTSDSMVFAPTTLASFKAEMGKLISLESGRPMSSSPHVRIFVNGSFRAWGKDDVPEGLHYVVVIAKPTGRGSRLPTIDLELPNNQNETAVKVSRRVAKIDLVAGRVIVHSTRLQYKVSVENSSVDPHDGLILVDGYIW